MINIVGIRIAAQMKLQNHLSHEPSEISSIAKLLGFNDNALLRLFKLLETYELAELLEEKYVIATDYTSLLETIDSEHYYSGYLAFEDFNYSLVNNEECFSKKLGCSYYEFLDQKPELAENLANYLERTGRDWLPSIFNIFDFSKFKYILDLGGGNGHFLAEILQKNSSALGVVFDTPKMIDEAKAYISKQSQDISNRIEFYSGDFFSDISLQSEIYLLCRVFLNLNYERAINLLKNISNAMPPQAKIIIIDFIVPSKNHPHYQRAVLHDLNLFAVFGGGIRTRSDWEKLIVNSGLLLEEFLITDDRPENQPNVPLCCIVASLEN